MPDALSRSLHPAASDELAETLAFALQYSGRKRVHDAAGVMARITADRLVQHLAASGFVVMKALPATAPTTAAQMPRRPD